MFTVDPNIADLKNKEKSLCNLLFSMNIHEVATPELSVEEARTYVLFFREGIGKMSAYIGLKFINSGRKLYYTHSANPFSSEDRNAVENEARNFAEDLGAMLDEIDIEKMSWEEKRTWFEEHDVFSIKKKTEEQASSPQSVQASVANAADAPAGIVQPVQPSAAQQPVIPDSETQSAPERSPRVQKSEATGKPAASRCEPQQQTQDIRKKQTAGPAAKTMNSPSSAAMESPVFERTDDVLEEAVKAGVVKAPKTQLTKEIQASAGVVSRDKEALARLFSSF